MLIYYCIKEIKVYLKIYLIIFKIEFNIDQQYYKL